MKFYWKSDQTWELFSFHQSTTSVYNVPRILCYLLITLHFLVEGGGAVRTTVMGKTRKECLFLRKSQMSLKAQDKSYPLVVGWALGTLELGLICKVHPQCIKMIRSLFYSASPPPRLLRGRVSDIIRGAGGRCMGPLMKANKPLLITAL